MMLELTNVIKSEKGFTLGPLSLRAEKGQYLILLGPSGAGKSMLLECIAGIRKTDNGLIRLNQADITKMPVQRRKTAMIFQGNTLFPHFSVFNNIAYPLRIKGMNKATIQQKVEQMATEMEITSLLHRKPASLSGGEAQRVAIARALGTDPECLLLDEPLSYLDIHIRNRLYPILKKLKNKEIPILHITHDPNEALQLADKIMVIEGGKIIFSGNPGDLAEKQLPDFLRGFHFDNMSNTKS